VDVEILTSDTCHLYSLLDVVLPLPGYSVTYPNNPVGEEYHKLLAADGLSSEKFMHRVKDFSLPGSYRYILIKPNDIKWKFLRYNDFKIPLSQSDLSIMAGDSPPSECPDGTKGALQLQFSLPSSSYATMALRELLVTDTSSHAQTILNVEACNNDDINKDESVTDKDEV
jgi:tRNA pseudouridine13 synthase